MKLGLNFNGNRMHLWQYLPCFGQVNNIITGVSNYECSFANRLGDDYPVL